MAAPPTSREILDVNRRYHDVAADDYDAKWGIDFGDVGRAQVRSASSTKLLGSRAPAAVRALARDRRGHRLLLAQPAAAPGVRRGTPPAPTSRPGMLETLRGQRARGSACSVRDRRLRRRASCRSRTQSFDLVLGHAVLHHLPALRARLRASSARVLQAPGGDARSSPASPRGPGRPHRGLCRSAPRCASRRSGARSSACGRPTPAASNGGTAAARRRPTRALESVVDVHAFDPADLERADARGAGLTRRPRSSGEELLANWFGWFNRTLEATARPRRRSRGPWRQYAFRGYLGLAAASTARCSRAAAPRRQVFYNLMIAARKP